MNCEVKKAHLWMKANKLTIDASESNALVISPGAKTILPTPEILCEGQKIAVSDFVKN